MSKKFKFTKRAIDALPPHDATSPSTDAEYSDTEVSGLKCIVSKKGRKSFLFRYTINGNKRSMTLGAFGVIDVDSARKKAQEARRLIANGIDPQDKPVAVKAVLTFKEFFDLHYLPDAKVRKRSWKDDESKMRIHLDPVFGKIPLDAISHMDINQYFTKIPAKGLAPATANRHLALLSCIFNMTVRFNLLVTNPCKGVKKHREDNQKLRYLNADELGRLLAVMDDNNPKTMEKNRVAVDVLKLLLLTGTRREEILHAEWSHVDLQQRTLFLPTTKAGKSRHVLLNDEAHDLLRNIVRDPACGYVFVNPKTHQRYNTPVKAFKRLLERANIEGVNIHTLRHTFASLAVKNGLSLYKVQHLLGHASSVTTQRYAHLDQETMLDATNVVGGVVRQAQQNSHAASAKTGGLNPI